MDDFSPSISEIPKGAIDHLALVMQQQDDSMRVLKLHLFTEFCLNEAIAAYLRTDKKGTDRMRLGYIQKVALVEVCGLLDKDCADFLRRLNKLRCNVAHELEYRLNAEDAETLLEGFGSRIPRVGNDVDFVHIAFFLSGYLGGVIVLAKKAAERLTNPSDEISQGDATGGP